MCRDARELRPDQSRPGANAVNTGEPFRTPLERSLLKDVRKLEAERDRLRGLLEQHDSYSIDSDLGVSVGRRPGQPWIVYRDGACVVWDTGRPAEPVRHDLLADAIAAAVCLTEALETTP